MEGRCRVYQISTSKNKERSRTAGAFFSASNSRVGGSGPFLSESLSHYNKYYFRLPFYLCNKQNYDGPIMIRDKKKIKVSAPL